MQGSLIPWIIVLLLAGLAVSAVVWYLRRKSGPAGRIRFLDRKKAVIVARGERRCSACRRGLTDDEAQIRCALNPEHVFHERCRVLLKGKCFECKGPLES